jgi:hypothetical protein
MDQSTGPAGAVNESRGALSESGHGEMALVGSRVLVCFRQSRNPLRSGRIRMTSASCTESRDLQMTRDSAHNHSRSGEAARILEEKIRVR